MRDIQISPAHHLDDSKEVGVALLKTDYALAKTGKFVWIDSCNNPLFTSIALTDEEGRITFDVALDQGVAETVPYLDGLFAVQTVEGMLFLAGYLDRHMRDTGH